MAIAKKSRKNSAMAALKGADPVGKQHPLLQGKCYRYGKLAFATFKKLL